MSRRRRSRHRRRRASVLAHVLVPLPRASHPARPRVPSDTIASPGPTHGEDEEAIRSLFEPELVALWETLDPEEHWAGAGKWVLVYRDQTQPGGGSPRNMEVQPEEIEPFLQPAETIAARLRQEAGRT